MHEFWTVEEFMAKKSMRRRRHRRTRKPTHRLVRLLDGQPPKLSKIRFVDYLGGSRVDLSLAAPIQLLVQTDRKIVAELLGGATVYRVSGARSAKMKRLSRRACMAHWLGRATAPLYVQVRYPLSPPFPWFRIDPRPATARQKRFGVGPEWTVGWIAWCVGQAYAHVYSDPERFGVWGHDIGDLVLAQIAIHGDRIQIGVDS